MVALFVASVIAGCGSSTARSGGPAAESTTTSPAAPATTQAAKRERVVPVYADIAQLQAGAQRIVDAVAAEVARVRGGALAEVPQVAVRNTPMLIFFTRAENEIVVPWWGTTPPEMREMFRAFAGDGDGAAEHLFRAFFNRFLIAHEAGHWFLDHANRREPTLYANERMANRFAVAFWRTQPDGEVLLAELEQLAARAADNLVDPTPAGEDPVAYFGANYQQLANEPLKYGYYQFRFMRDALRERAQLDFAVIVAKSGT